MSTPLPGESNAIALALTILGDQDATASTALLQRSTLDDWRAVVLLARAQLFAPLLYRQLKLRRWLEYVPKDVAYDLRVAYLNSFDRNLNLYRQLAEILMALEHAHIPVVVLKGAHLAERVYGNIAARSMRDLDILVMPKDLARVAQIMEALSYVSKFKINQVVQETHHLVFDHPEKIRVEIHWGLTDSRYSVRIDLDELWQRACPSMLAGIPIYEMTPEDQILYHCIHTSIHIFERGLRAMCDIAETIRHYRATIDWARLAARAAEWCANRCAYVNLQLVRDLLNAPVPDELLAALAPENFEPRYIEWARAYSLSDRMELGPTPGLARTVEFWQQPNLSGKLKALWKSVLPSRREMALRYPASPDSLRIFLYYPILFKTLWQENSAVLWRLLRGEEQMVACAHAQAQATLLQDWLLRSEIVF